MNQDSLFFHRLPSSIAESCILLSHHHIILNLPLASLPQYGLLGQTTIFTSPSTGIYKITANGQFLRNNAEILYCGLYIFATGDNFSSEDYLSSNFGSINNTASAYQNVVVEAVYDVTDVTNNKVKFNLYQKKYGLV